LTRRLGNWLLGYGAFLIAVGVVGFPSNPELLVAASLITAMLVASVMTLFVLVRGARGRASTEPIPPVASRTTMQLSFAPSCASTLMAARLGSRRGPFSQSAWKHAGPAPRYRPCW
jgi:hypothetical protein